MSVFLVLLVSGAGLVESFVLDLTLKTALALIRLSLMNH